MLKSRVMGGLLGVVVGDALGLPVQFLTREEVRINPIQEMTGHGTFNYPPGSWSDDSSLTLCLVESLCEKGYDPEDLGQRFVMWYKDGHWTPFGVAYDIGGTTKEAMQNLIAGVSTLKAGPSDEHSNGNGSLMRILPVALYYASVEDAEMLKKVCEISRLTHGHPRSQLACCLYSLMIKELLKGVTPVDAYEVLRRKANSIFINTNLAGELATYQRILGGMLPTLPETAINSGGYAVDSLEAALWCLLNHNNFRETIVAAVNLGEDTDTVGAITGGLAGVYYGFQSIPEEWLRVVVRIGDIKNLCQKFTHAVVLD